MITEFIDVSQLTEVKSTGVPMVIQVTVPEGWRIIDFRVPEVGDYYLDANYLQVKILMRDNPLSSRGPRFIVEKIGDDNVLDSVG